MGASRVWRGWLDAAGFRTLFGILACGIILGCGPERAVDGGGATETGNGIRVLVASSDGRPLAAAKVRLVRVDTWSRDVAAAGAPQHLDLVADAKGVARIDRLPPGEWAAQSDGQGLSGRLAVSADTAPQTLELRPAARVRIAAPGAAGILVRVAATAWSARLDSSGQALLDLPPGEHPLVARVAADLAALGVVKVKTQAAIDTVLRIEPRRVVLDDFSTDDGKTEVWRYTGLGNWYVAASPGTRIFSDTDTARASFAGWLSLRYALGTPDGYAAAGISFRDAQGYHPLDLSRMDSLCFDLRGSGTLEVHWQRLGTGQFGVSAHALLDALPADWKRVCLDRGAFGAEWESLKTAANDLVFLSRRGGRLELRDIVLWGVPLQALAR